MTLISRKDEEYLGYRILVLGGYDVLFLVAHVKVTDPRQQLVCRFEERLDDVLLGLAEWPADRAEATNLLVKRAFHRARGAILLDRLRDLNGARLAVPEEDSYARRSREYIQRVVLVALERVIRLGPHSYGHVFFDDLGICLLEDIDPKEMDYVLERLRREHLVEHWAMGDERGNRTLRATDAGLLAADRLIVERNAPGFLVEETVAKVESTLNKYKPELVESLRRQSLRIAEARELSEHEVGEIAQACEQVIWDFLDLDVLWEGIAEERPAKDRTRDRLRRILKARASSETEAELLEALEQYVAGWFGPLQQFIHKHRHLPGESDRRHAKRCVVYTYLLLSDVLEVLGL